MRNFGKADLRDVRLSFYLNGQGNIVKSPVIPHLPANQERTATTSVRFQELSPEDKAKLGPRARFRLITVTLGTPDKDGGLTVDDTRHTIVEVRDSLKVLVVDGRTVAGGVDLRQSPKGDSYFLRTMLTSQRSDDDEYLGKIEVKDGNFAALEKEDLRQYATVYLMNVPTLSEAAVKKLDQFVRQGGGVGVYLGPDVKPEDYRQRMYADGTGFFPVPLELEPSRELSAEEKLLRGAGLNPKLMLRNPANRLHPAIKGLYTDNRGQPVKENKVDNLFLLPIIDRYWPVSRRGKWLENDNVKELYCLPNETPISQYETPAVELVEAVKKAWGEPKFDKARKFLAPLLETIRRTPAEARPLSELARLLDQLLCDQVNTGDESEPVLREFWAQPELADARKKATALRDGTKFGPPLLVVKEHGLGRVAVITTDASGTHAGDKQWNDWASGQAAAGWTPVANQLQKYLAGGGDDANRSVGDLLSPEFDSARFEPTVEVHLLTADASKPPVGRADPVGREATPQDNDGQGFKARRRAPRRARTAAETRLRQG